MRLSLFEIETIVKLKNKYFDQHDNIYLFGSRVDDNKKGGDIDLYIVRHDFSTQDYNKKIEFISELQNIIGEQKIDVILSKDSSRTIEIEAKKGIELDLNKIKLKKYFTECDKHLQRIEEAYSDIENILPLTVQKYKNLSKEEVRDIDQYLYRFSKLQDTLGQKIFKLIIEIYLPSEEAIPFLDTLNKLEKLEFLHSTKEWINLRNKRNKIAHQYDDEPEEMTQAINDILNQKNILKSIYVHIKQKSQTYLKD
jgi:predicted nucleotidyltransferase